MKSFSKEKINRICSIVILSSTFIGIISYFLPFAHFFITFNYFQIIEENAEGYIPVFFSVAAFVLAVVLMKHDGSFRLVYICGAAASVALCNVFVLMGDDSDIISLSDISGIGYILFLIAHGATVLACIIYRFAGSTDAGRSAVKPRSAASPALEKSMAASARPSVKVCRSCGANIDSDAVFCPYCGNPTAAPKESPRPSVVFCPTCGDALPSASSVCPRCSRKDKPSTPDGWFVSNDLD